MLKIWKIWAEIYMGNTIEYDVKSCQIKTDIVKFTKVCIKVLNFNRSQKEMLVWPACGWNKKINSNKKWSRNQFQFE